MNSIDSHAAKCTLIASTIFETTAADAVDEIFISLTRDMTLENKLHRMCTVD